MTNDKTKWLFEHTEDPANSGLSDPGGAFTENLGAGGHGYDDPTYVDPSRSGSETPTVFVENADGKTEIFHSGKAFDELSGDLEELSDPVVGWFVVVKGPGIGRSVPIGAGMNMVGRDDNVRMSLPFGDKLISGKDHVRVIYDDESRQFLIAPGSGTNITKMNKRIVATPLELTEHAVIELSKRTHVRFVPFCNESFDWSDLSKTDGDDSK